MEPGRFDTICLVGLGLLGSSLGHGIKRAGLAQRVVGVDSHEPTRARALEIGFVDEATGDAATAAAAADLIILCTPVGTFETLGAAMGPAIRPGAILSDVGSVKGVMAELSRYLPPGAHNVPAHPVAGTERSGPDAGFAALFEGRWCILTPPDGTDAGAVAAVTAFWEALGSKVDVMTPARHDLVLAITSHIPHLIAYNIVGTAADLETVTKGEVIKYSAGGFRDFTRIAASDPDMWRDIFVANKDAVLEMLGRFSEDLSALQRAIRWEDGDALHELFSRTREIRKGVIDAGQDS